MKSVAKHVGHLLARLFGHGCGCVILLAALVPAIAYAGGSCGNNNNVQAQQSVAPAVIQTAPVAAQQSISTSSTSLLTNATNISNADVIQPVCLGCRKSAAVTTQTYALSAPAVATYNQLQTFYIPQTSYVPMTTYAQVQAPVQSYAPMQQAAPVCPACPTNAPPLQQQQQAPQYEAPPQPPQSYAPQAYAPIAAAPVYAAPQYAYAPAPQYTYAQPTQLLTTTVPVVTPVASYTVRERAVRQPVVRQKTIVIQKQRVGGLL